jgi:hypothetical protein
VARGDPSHEDAAADAGPHSRELRASTNRPACDGATVS